MAAKMMISNKIMKIYVINQDEENLRLDRYLKILFPVLKQSQIEIFLRKKDILLNDKKTSASARLSIDDKLMVNEFFLKNITNAENSEITTTKKAADFNPTLLQKIKNSIIVQNENFIILNKPHGLAAQGGTKITHSLDNYLKILFPQASPKLVHRLDKDTTGAIIVALNLKAAQILANDIKERQFKKKYLAVVVGMVKKPEGEIILNLNNDYKVTAGDNGLKSITYYKVLMATKNISLLEVTPITGRKHQIRASCLEMGHPILGDGKYGGNQAFVKGFANKLHLHSYMIAIKNSLSNSDYYAEISDYMKDTLAKIGFSEKSLKTTTF